MRRRTFAFYGLDANDVWKSLITGLISVHESEVGELKPEVRLVLIERALEYPHKDQEDRRNSLGRVIEDCYRYMGPAINYDDFLEIHSAAAERAGRTIN